MRRSSSGSRPGGQELRQGGAFVVQDADGAVAGTGHRAGLLDDVRSRTGNSRSASSRSVASSTRRSLTGSSIDRYGTAIQRSGLDLLRAAQLPVTIVVVVRGDGMARRVAMQWFTWEDDPVSFRVCSLLDDHEVVRAGLRSLLEATDDIVVVGEAGTVAEALARIPPTRPDVAILDVRLPDGSGVEVCREVRSRVRRLRV